jgi:Outer membrane protein beta-barrel domain
MKIMKKVVTFVFSMVMLAAIAQAQEVAIGIKGGLNFAKLDVNGTFSSNYKSHTGFNAGAFVLFKLSKIGIQPELLFSDQGTKFTVPNSSASAQKSFSYVNIPVLFKLYTIAGINIQLGPQFGFLTNSPTVQDPNGQTISSAYKKSDLSAAMGLGWDLPFGLSIDARYNLGLTKIQSGNNPYDTKNQVFQVSVGYKIIKLGH